MKTAQFTKALCYFKHCKVRLFLWNLIKTIDIKNSHHQPSDNNDFIVEYFKNTGFNWTIRKFSNPRNITKDICFKSKMEVKMKNNKYCQRCVDRKTAITFGGDNGTCQRFLLFQEHVKYWKARLFEEMRPVYSKYSYVQIFR